MSVSRVRATVSSDCLQRMARPSMACKVWSRVMVASASNIGEPSIKRISVLVRAMMSGQSASPMARKDVMALLTLRLSAA